MKQTLLYILIIAFIGIMVSRDNNSNSLYADLSPAELANLSPAAGSSASATGTATVTVLSPIHITAQTPLRFGTIEEVNSAGTIEVTPLNSRHVTGNITVSSQPSFDRATIDVQGAANKAYSIHMPDSLLFTKEGTTSIENVTTLQVIQLQSYSETQGTVTTNGQLNTQGKDRIFVGGTLVVPNTASPGSYSGDVPITVTY